MLSACLTGVLGVIRSLALSGNGFGCCVSLLLIAVDWFVSDGGLPTCFGRELLGFGFHWNEASWRWNEPGLLGLSLLAGLRGGPFLD